MRALPLFLLLALAASACDSSGPPPGQGEFEATLRGDLSADLTGGALITLPRHVGEDAGVSITMGTQGFDPSSLRTLTLGGALSREGTYRIAPGDRTSGALQLSMLSFGEDGAFFAATSGRVEIRRFSADRIDGTFEAELVESFADDEPQRVRVEGSFRAVASPYRF